MEKLVLSDEQIFQEIVNLLTLFFNETRSMNHLLI